MARTIQQIKAAMTQQFMSDSVIRTKYGITGDATFDNTFSKVSLESIWFSIVASAIWVLESIFDVFRADVEERISSSVMASIPWYHQVALEFQYGDELIFDEKTQQFVYPEIHPDNQVVKFAAARDLGGGVLVLAAGADANGKPQKLSTAVLTAFEGYMNQRKPAGVIMEVESHAPDQVYVYAQVQYDPQLLNANGQLLADTSVRPVDVAVDAYLSNIVYGGVLNKTKLVDAIQGATGVIDLVLDRVEVDPEYAALPAPFDGNNYTSYSGAFVSNNLNFTIEYVLSL